VFINQNKSPLLRGDLGDVCTFKSQTNQTKAKPKTENPNFSFLFSRGRAFPSFSRELSIYQPKQVPSIKRGFRGVCTFKSQTNQTKAKPKTENPNFSFLFQEAEHSPLFSRELSVYQPKQVPSIKRGFRGVYTFKSQTNQTKAKPKTENTNFSFLFQEAEHSPLSVVN
jgi:hypothetical protein